MPSTETRVTLFGNPGRGKSTILNTIIHEVRFQSGCNIGTGKTNKLQDFSSGGICYCDTPGLADAVSQANAAKEIEQSLKMGVSYKIIFVITLLSGRVLPEDLHTINIVCESITIQHIIP